MTALVPLARVARVPWWRRLVAWWRTRRGVDAMETSLAVALPPGLGARFVTIKLNPNGSLAAPLEHGASSVVPVRPLVRPPPPTRKPGGGVSSPS